MTRKIVMVTALLALVSIGAFAVESDFGALGAKDKTGLSLEQMLTYAIQDEYLARSEYAMITERYGNLRPFSNIRRAEERHIQELTGLFSAYGLRAPEDLSGGRVVLPPDLKTALETGVKAEVDNIAMYQAFLGTAASAPLPDDVREVFEQLKSASQNHLRAFQTKLSRLK